MNVFVPKCFIHHTFFHKRNGKSVTKEEKPTASGVYNEDLEVAE